MEKRATRPVRMLTFILNHKLISFLLIVLLVSLNVFIFTKISFIFSPFIIFIKTVLFPVLLAGVLYYLLNPIVDFLEQWRIKRFISILILYILIIGIITVVVLAVIPVIRKQVIDLIANVPGFSTQIETLFRDMIGSEFFNRIQQSIDINSSNFVSSLSERATSLLNNTFNGIGGFLGAVTETILGLVIVPFVLFYLLKDGRRLPEYILTFLPTSLRKQSYQVMSEMNNQISSYIRGQIIVSFCIGILLYAGYLIIGLEYSLILAVIAACTSIVPYLGPAIAITPALIVALVTSPMMLLKMIIVWTIVQLVEGKLISPQIMGKTLHIHPITIIFVILTAGNLFGVVGIILAVPGYAVLKVVVTHLFDWFKRRSNLYDDHLTM
ncbi:AI-2E family transporter [Paenibacillus alvei]|uniref:AI-2E family transporter n=1 Tax=Paenibacillus alvei TaxID=44250 RepID=UPI00227EC4EA|nr:AI-2E family transporter [Paenibacillus alvei]MCY7482981.1 AI-2E family transporter [Paenibacillus alvei]